MNRRTLLTGVAGLAAVSAVAACSDGDGGTGGGEGADASWWSLTGMPNERIHAGMVERYNEMDDRLGDMEITAFQNDPYKERIHTALGAGEAPTLFYGWGGGILRSYINDGVVHDMTPWLEENSEFRDKFSPSLWRAVTADDKLYGVPLNGTQPVILYYHREIFADAGLEPPTTWQELLQLIDNFNSDGVVPLSLAGQSRWTNMMYLQYLLDRIGGAGAFQAIFDKEPDAWLNPAVIEMCEKVQELVAADAFPASFASMAADNNADQALMWTGQAAMLLQGGWAFPNMKANGGDFVQRGGLGFTMFPTIEGGQGNLEDLCGNPSNYVSIYEGASDEEKATAQDFIIRQMWSDDSIQEWTDGGAVVGFEGVEDFIAGSDDEEFLNFVSTSLNEAQNFTQSWDQALDPTAAEQLLRNIDDLFLENIGPEEFSQNMNATL